MTAKPTDINRENTRSRPCASHGWPKKMNFSSPSESGRAAGPVCQRPFPSVSPCTPRRHQNGCCLTASPCPVTMRMRLTPHSFPSPQGHTLIPALWCGSVSSIPLLKGHYCNETTQSSGANFVLLHSIFDFPEPNLSVDNCHDIGNYN